MEFEVNWPRGFRGVVHMCGRTADERACDHLKCLRRTDDGPMDNRCLPTLYNYLNTFSNI